MRGLWHPWEMEQILVNEARAIHTEGLTVLLQKMTTAFPSSFFPARITQELLHNPRLSIAMLINSSTSPALYKSILNDCDRVTAPIDATKETKDRVISKSATNSVADFLFG